MPWSKFYFDRIYYENHQLVYYTIYRYIKDKAIVEDILQEVFIALWSNRHKLDDEERIKGWLIVVSSNKAISYLKQDIKHKIALYADMAALLPWFETDEDLLAVEVSEAQWQLLQEAIESLSVRRQQVFRLCRIEGRTYKDTAQIMGISIDAVKEYLVAANKRIKDYVRLHYRPSNVHI